MWGVERVISLWVFVLSCICDSSVFCNFVSRVIIISYCLLSQWHGESAVQYNAVQWVLPYFMDCWRSSLPGILSGYSDFLPSFIGECFSQYNQAQINAISTLSNLIAELSLLTTWHVTRHAACDRRSMCCTWFAHDCTWATWAYVLETVCGSVGRL